MDWAKWYSSHMAQAIYKLLSFAGTVVFAIEAITFVVLSDPVRLLGTEIDPRVMLTAYRFLAVFCGISFLGLNYKWIGKAWAAMLGRRPTARFRALSDDFEHILRRERYFNAVDRPPDLDYAMDISRTVRSLNALGIATPIPQGDRDEWDDFIGDMWEMAQEGDLKGARALADKRQEAKD